jgi:hypothetical protein
MDKTSSLNQGLNFQKLTASYHGGSRKNEGSNKKMAKKSGTKRKALNMRGGGSFFTPYADYPTSMDTMLPSDIRALAKIAPLDAKFAELPAIERAAGVPMSGGRRTRRNKRKQRGGQSPIDAPSMLLTSAEELDARLNPQWYTENTVIPSFRGPIPIPGGTTPAPAPPAKGGRRIRRRLSMRR